MTFGIFQCPWCRSVIRKYTGREAAATFKDTWRNCCPWRLGTHQPRFLQYLEAFWWLITFLRVSSSLCLNTCPCNSCWIFIFSSCPQVTTNSPCDEVCCQMLTDVWVTALLKRSNLSSASISKNTIEKAATQMKGKKVLVQSAIDYSLVYYRTRNNTFTDTKEIGY